jgi:phosphopantetheinyl transferase
LTKGRRGGKTKKMSHRGTGEVEKRGRPVTSGRVEEFSASHLGRSVLPALVAQQIGVGVGQFVGSKVAVVEVEIRLAV